eukprot:2797255-Rhodomonas_salina.1
MSERAMAKMRKQREDMREEREVGRCDTCARARAFQPFQQHNLRPRPAALPLAPPEPAPQHPGQNCALRTRPTETT